LEANLAVTYFGHLSRGEREAGAGIFTNRLAKNGKNSRPVSRF